MGSSNNPTNEDELLLSRVYNDLDVIVRFTFTHTISVQCSLVKPPPSVQSLVWRYNEFGDKLKDIENRKLCDHMKR
jgi:16S rRNA A1518/A1519 N6-dimethyltransferase RsmA/KsgA/DIM1 with predicted DNA glycosylase/AP lyase activity